MSPSLDKVSPTTNHVEFGLGGWENEKWCEGSTRAAQRCTYARRQRRSARRGNMEDCTVTLDLVLRLGREMQSLSGTGSKPDELMRVLIAQRTYARFTLAM